VATRRTQEYARKLLQSPENFVQHIRRTAGGTILDIAYGYDIADEGVDPFVRNAEIVMDITDKCGEPGWIPDIIPATRYLPEWFPGAGFKRTAREWRALTDKFLNEPMEYVRRGMQDGSARSSLTSRLLTDAGEGGMAAEEYDIIRWGVGALYAGGSDTTVSVAMSFFLAMTLNPDIQRHAQAELDHLTKGTRLPCLEDRTELPYVNAILQESHRWNLVFPLGFYHVSSEDDVYEGYHIPKGSIMIPNNWGVVRDPTNYAMPDEFRPERFLGPQPEEDPKNYVFGYGRRECPGKYFADTSLFLMIATTLAVFDISPPVDAHGKAVLPKVEYTGTIIRHVVPFDCIILPRSAAAAALLA